MTSKQRFLHILGVIVYLLLTAGPSLVTGFTKFNMPGYAHAFAAVLLVIGVPYFRQLLPIPPADSVAKKPGPPPVPLAVFAFVLMLGCAAALKSLTVAEEVCQDTVLITSQIPPGTPVSQVASDVQVACDIADDSIPIIEQVVTALEAAQADAGTVAAPAYVPSPLVAKAKAHKAAAKKN
jgi:hypothetical protein